MYTGIVRLDFKKLALWLGVLVLVGLILYFFWFRTGFVSLMMSRLGGQSVPISRELFEKARSSGFVVEGQFQEGDAEGRSIVYDGREGADEIERQFVFWDWEEIKDSKDRYAVVEAAGEKDRTRSRVVFDKSGKWRSTELLRDNLSDSQREPERLGYFSGMTDKEADELLRPGDVVNYMFLLKEGGEEIVVDVRGIPVLEWLEIRRFK